MSDQEDDKKEALFEVLCKVPVHVAWDTDGKDSERNLSPLEVLSASGNEFTDPEGMVILSWGGTRIMVNGRQLRRAAECAEAPNESPSFFKNL